MGEISKFFCPLWDNPVIKSLDIYSRGLRF
uniref:Uncharacterized protein n=1 Tax=Rhizophora mucronata TaxID=61149 RepID=A0A2P2R3S7_RHIMU